MDVQNGEPGGTNIGAGERKISGKKLARKTRFNQTAALRNLEALKPAVKVDHAFEFIRQNIAIINAKRHSGKLCVSVKYGAKVIELAKGKSAVELAKAADLVATLETLKQAVEAGELDAQIEAACGAVKAGFKK